MIISFNNPLGFAVDFLLRGVAGIGFINFPDAVFGFLLDLLSSCLSTDFVNCDIKYCLDFSHYVFNLIKI